MPLGIHSRKTALKFTKEQKKELALKVKLLATLSGVPLNHIGPNAGFSGVYVAQLSKGEGAVYSDTIERITLFLQVSMKFLKEKTPATLDEAIIFLKAEGKSISAEQINSAADISARHLIVSTEGVKSARSKRDSDWEVLFWNSSDGQTLLKNIENHAKTIKNFLEMQPAILRPAIIAKIFGNVSH
jgi:hypothetical protein